MKCIILLFSALFLFSCNNNVPSISQLDSVDSIVIENKTMNNRIADKFVIKDNATLAELIEHVEQSDSIAEVSVKLNFGYFHVKLYKRNSVLTYYDVIYTVYSGVIINDYNDTYYKNDNLELYISNLFDKDQKTKTY